ncbi:MAG: metallophosphoesterase [Candidatus Omnitrophica bacterium]|nr:metallophosphoesterase [Candidatus Omnitrophota bacterium]
MRIGLVSDTHDNLDKIKKAVKLFNSKRVELVLHAGDFVAPFTIHYLDKLNCEYLGVFGNNDGEKEGLKRKSGGKIKDGPVELMFEDIKIALVHDLKALPARNFDIIVFGHSHKKELRKEGKTLLVNPGECGGWLTGKSTAAILDTDKLSVKFFKL